VIPSDDAMLKRIIRLGAQILRASERAHRDALLKVFFNDNPLIFVAKCTHSAGPGGLEIGIMP